MPRQARLVAAIRSRHRLIAAMRAAGLDNRGLHRRAGVAVGVVSMLRCGRRTGVTLDTAHRIADALAVPTERLFYLDDDDEPAA